MGMTDIERKALKGSGATQTTPAEVIIEPLAVRLDEASRISGFSRSDLYRRAARGEIIFRKSGKTVLVDYATLKAAALGLPIADIRVAA